MFNHHTKKDSIKYLVFLTPGAEETEDSDLIRKRLHFPPVSSLYREFSRGSPLKALQNHRNLQPVHQLNSGPKGTTTTTKQNNDRRLEFESWDYYTFLMGDRLKLNKKEFTVFLPMVAKLRIAQKWKFSDNLFSDNWHAEVSSYRQSHC